MADLYFIERYEATRVRIHEGRIRIMPPEGHGVLWRGSSKDRMWAPEVEAVHSAPSPLY